MEFRAGSPVVKYLPEAMSRRQQRQFFAEVESCFNTDRPCIVLDCSRVRQIDRSTIHLLLCCLEEAMKRNGDVKLAAIPDGVRALLEHTGANRVFEGFDTTAEALGSFCRPRVGVVPNVNLRNSSQPNSENAK